jgi:hypothetical protein
MSPPLPPVLDSEHAADPAGYTLGGLAPRMALKPASAEEAAAALAASSADGLAVISWGAGSRIARDVTPERYDVALDLSGLDRILEYNPEDFTLTAECDVDEPRKPRVAQVLDGELAALDLLPQREVDLLVGGQVARRVGDARARERVLERECLGCVGVEQRVVEIEQQRRVRHRREYRAGAAAAASRICGSAR